MKSASRKPFVSPELVVYGSIAQITKTSCPNHGSTNDGAGTDGPNVGCPGGTASGQKKT